MQYTITLTIEQLNIIGNALGEISYRIAAPVIQSINEQIVASIQPAQETREEADDIL